MNYVYYYEVIIGKLHCQNIPVSQEGNSSLSVPYILTIYCIKLKMQTQETANI